MTDTVDYTQAALAAIQGLTFADCFRFFDAKATHRDQAIAALVDTDDTLNVDGAITSEGDDNGAWVLAWVWVDFSGTELDETEQEDAELAEQLHAERVANEKSSTP